MRRIRIIIAALLLAPLSANAILIDRGNTTFDTATGLEWLDLTLTLGKRHNNIVAQGFGGYIAAGYRYATTAEVCGLMSAFGDTIPACQGQGNTGPIAQSSADTLVALLGNTLASVGYSGSYGILDGGFFGSMRVGLGCIDAGPSSLCSSFIPGILLLNNQGGFSTASPVAGSFLVRRIPEPGALALLGLGLMGMGLARRRKTV